VLIGETAKLVERSIRASCLDLETVLHALSVMPDHIHVALSIPPKHSVSSVVKRLKGSSSHLVNHAEPHLEIERFSWQSEYGALTFGRKVLKDVVAYIVNQPTRHADLDLWDGMERTGEPG
jgi:REP element-mobilizing transposase RayT